MARLVARTTGRVGAGTERSARLHCLRSEAMAAAARRFADSFVGETVVPLRGDEKPELLQALTRAGIHLFEVNNPDLLERLASILPGAHWRFDARNLPASAIRRTHEIIDVCDFVVSTLEDIRAVQEETDGETDLGLWLAVDDPARGAALTKLLVAAEAVADRVGLLFAEEEPDAVVKLTWALDLCRSAGVAPEMIDVGPITGEAGEALAADLARLDLAWEAAQVPDSCEIFARFDRHLAEREVGRMVRARSGAQG